MNRAASIFIGHGSPMNAITDNAFARAWRNIGERLLRPKAVLCVSAHWETPTPEFCTADPPKTIHDFSGFPRELHAVQYTAPGAPFLAARLRELTNSAVAETTRWGLDHGAWQVLLHLFPDADIPVAQLSLAQSMSPIEHLRFARQLRSLRDEGVLIFGSGNIVHNLRLAGGTDTPAWAIEFDAYVRDALVRGDDDALARFDTSDAINAAAKLAVPTLEHYLPLLYVAATRYEEEAPSFHTEAYDWGSISMRSVSYGL